MVVTGAKSEDNCKSAARTFAKMVRRCGFEVAFKQFKIQNVVGVADVNFQIRLEALQMQHKQFCQYEPEVFPGAIYRLMQPKVVLLIFVSGRVVITGAKGREDTKKAFDSIYPLLIEFKKQRVVQQSLGTMHTMTTKTSQTHLMRYYPNNSN
jgi:transcription initiation factor TFIID TATA-box-binding protein